MSDGHVHRTLRQRFEASERALAASQADVTRLAAELAESVRALAVSQGEAKRLDGELDAKHAKLVEVADKLRAARGDLERARAETIERCAKVAEDAEEWHDQYAIRDQILALKATP